jgi:peptidoglycan/xylan/chitin deacetylase (PgdA/CDA1 family)
MNGPADKAPPDPERGDPVKVRWAKVLAILAAVCIFATFVLAGAHVHHNPTAIKALIAAAVVLSLAALVVLAGKGRQP